MTATQRTLLWIYAASIGIWPIRHLVISWVIRRLDILTPDSPRYEAPEPPLVTAIVPAKDEEERIDATVRAALGIEGVDVVVVVDDGSTDRTAVTARAAGARVVRHHRNRGKAAALESGAALVRELEDPPDGVVHDAPGLLGGLGRNTLRLAGGDLSHVLALVDSRGRSFLCPLGRAGRLRARSRRVLDRPAARATRAIRGRRSGRRARGRTDLVDA